MLHHYYLDKHARYERRHARFAEHGLKVLRLDAERPPEDNARLIMDRLVHPYVTNGQACLLSHPGALPRLSGSRRRAVPSKASQVAARPARVVEFVGLPGAGKTTAARWLADRLAKTKPRR